VTAMFVVYAGGASQIVHRPAVEKYPQHRQPDITKAKKILHWHPMVSNFFLFCVTCITL